MGGFQGSLSSVKVTDMGAVAIKAAVEYPISRFYIDARVQTIYGGTSEIMKEVIARSMLGKYNSAMGLPT